MASATSSAVTYLDSSASMRPMIFCLCCGVILKEGKAKFKIHFKFDKIWVRSKSNYWISSNHFPENLTENGCDFGCAKYGEYAFNHFGNQPSEQALMLIRLPVLQELFLPGQPAHPWIHAINTITCDVYSIISHTKTCCRSCFGRVTATYLV